MYNYRSYMVNYDNFTHCNAMRALTSVLRTVLRSLHFRLARIIHSS